MASERAKNGGGQERPLQSEQLASSYGGGQAPSNPNNRGSSGIQRGTPADWFGPLNPMEPTAPPEVAGRLLDYQSGYNLAQQPRAYNAITFPVLRYFASAYDLLRIIIETRKDEMERLKWGIAPRDNVKMSPELEGRQKTIESFFLRPDREHFWGQWLRMVLEDLLVLDAPSIYKRRTRSGELYSLEVLDGSTIKRVIDDWGRTPQPPIAAYQQALKGFPAVNYTTRDLLYMPRNLRPGEIYGYSPVEQILMTINIGLRREVFQLNYFTEGNMPDSLIGVPETWSPDQVRAFQDWWDGMMDGNLAQRRKAKFVPGGVGKTFVQTKDTELFGQAEQWLARVVCFAFSISPQPFITEINRATAETAQEVAATNGLAPLMSWVKNMVDTIMVDEFGETELEFKWLEEEEMDPKVESEILRGYSADGVMSINEARQRIGLDPDPSPDANRLMVKTATGYVPVFLTAEEKAQKDAEKAALQAALGAGAPPGEEGKKPGAPGQPTEDKPTTNAEDDAPTPGMDPNNAAPRDQSQLGKANRGKDHDASVKEVERVAQRTPFEADATVTFGETPDAGTITAVLNAAALKEPNWR